MLETMRLQWISDIDSDKVNCMRCSRMKGKLHRVGYQCGFTGTCSGAHGQTIEEGLEPSKNNSGRRYDAIGMETDPNNPQDIGG